MNTAIKNATRHKIKNIVMDVTADGSVDMGSPVYKITKRGQPYSDYRTHADIMNRGRDEFVSEGSVYRHIYFCDDTVPVEIVEMLRGSK